MLCLAFLQPLTSPSAAKHNKNPLAFPKIVYRKYSFLLWRKMSKKRNVGYRCMAYWQLTWLWHLKCMIQVILLKLLFIIYYNAPKMHCCHKKVSECLLAWLKYCQHTGKWSKRNRFKKKMRKKKERGGWKHIIMVNWWLW